MRNFFILIIALLALTNLQGQTIEFSLVYQGVNETTDNYQVALLATPSSSLTDATMQDMGGGFYLPSGLTIGNFAMGTSGLPASEWTSQTLGSNGNGDAFFVSRVESGNSVNLNGLGPFQLVIFDVIADPNPTTGSILFVENGDPVFDSLFIQNYINLDFGAGAIDVYGQNDPLANSISFSTLSNPDNRLLGDLKIYPNPSSNYIFIKGNLEIINEIEIFTMSGQKLLQLKDGFDRINVESFESGIYFIKIYSSNASKTIKLIKD
jgi:hypothetical protein